MLYSSRRQSDKLRADVKATGKGPVFSFAQRRDPCIGIFGKIMSFFEKPKRGQENISVTVNPNFPGLPSKGPKPDPAAGHRTTVDNLWLATDNSSYLEINAETMEPVGTARQQMLHPDLKGPLSCAHAEKDPETGDLFNFNIDVGRLATYRVFRVSAATGKTEILATWSEAGAKAAYIHSFFMTENHVVVCIPTTHYGWGGAKLMWEKNIISSIEPFDEAKLCKWYIVDRRHGRGVVARFETPAGFFFHSANAFEEPTADGRSVNLFCDYVAFPNFDILHGLYYENLLNRTNFWTSGRVENAAPSLTRYRFRIPTWGGEKNAVAKREVEKPELVFSIPGPHVGELPTINPAYTCKRHRYIYSTSTRGLSTLADSLVKTDTKTRHAVMWVGPRGHTPGEAIFVARPGASGEGGLAEDDGVLLSVVLDGTAEKSYLLCLDARTMAELGRAECDFPVGLGFHGHHAKLA